MISSKVVAVDVPGLKCSMTSSLHTHNTPSMEIVVEISTNPDGISVSSPSSSEDHKIYHEDISNSEGRQQGEPTLYKTVIYVPSEAAPLPLPKSNEALEQERRQPQLQASLDCYSRLNENKIKLESYSNESCNEIPDTTGTERVEGPEPDGSSNNSGSNNEDVYISQGSCWLNNGSSKAIILKCCVGHQLIWEVMKATVVLFWMSLIWSLAVGTWLKSKTEGTIGSVEVLFSTFLCGTLFSLLGVHSISSLGVSCPCAIFTVAVFKTATYLSLDFAPWLAWIGIWSSLTLILIAISKAYMLALHLTEFTWEVLQLFISLSLLTHSITQVVEFFTAEKETIASSLLSLWISTSTFFTVFLLRAAKGRHSLSMRTHFLLSGCGPFLIYLVFSVFPNFSQLRELPIAYVELPSFGYHSDTVSRLCTLVSLKRVPLWAILLAAIPGILFAFFIVIDQSATILFLQDAGHISTDRHILKCKDMILFSGLLLICSLLGLPFCYSMFPQSIVNIPGMVSRPDNGTGRNGELTKVQRMSNLFVSLLSSMALVPHTVWLMRRVPQGVLAGYMMQMGSERLLELNITKHVGLALSCHQSAPLSDGDGISMDAITVYILLQGSCAGILTAIAHSRVAAIFPLLLLATVWLRHRVLDSRFECPPFSQLDRRLYTPQYSTNGGSQSPQNKSIRSISGNNPLDIDESDDSMVFNHQTSAILTETNSRRLKERSLRRKKRKRLESADINGNESSVLKQKQNTSCVFSLASEQTPFSSRDMQLSNVTGTSQKLIQKKSGTSDEMQVHSNLLYDPFWGDTIVQLSDIQEHEMPFRLEALPQTDI